MTHIGTFTKNGKTYYQLVDEKGHYLKYLGKDPRPFIRDMKLGEQVADILKRYPDLAGKSSQAIITEYKRRQMPKFNLDSNQKYHTIVIDPPWPIEKILRDERPNQDEFDYPTMEIDAIKRIPLSRIACEDGCHIYLWTTQKYLPHAFDILANWGVEYQCLITWVKNVGFTPFSWMYSTEHCLFGRIGALPLLRLGMRLDFNAKVREHSRKPDEFYDLVKQASPEPRLDMFSREKRDGFDQLGNEIDKYGV